MSRCHCPATPPGAVTDSWPHSSFYSLDLSIALKGYYQRGLPRSWSGSVPASSGCPSWQSLWGEQASCVTHKHHLQGEGKKPGDQGCLSVTPIPTSPFCPSPAQGSISLSPPPLLASLSPPSLSLSVLPLSPAFPSPSPPPLGLFDSPCLTQGLRRG